MAVNADKETIKLLITIDKETYNDIKNRTISFHDIPLETFNAITNGMLIPKGQKWVQVDEEQSLHVNFDSSEPTKIIYKPHCEKCGAVINQKVQFKRHVYELNNVLRYLPTPELYEFNPWHCEECGAVFNSAEVTPPQEVEYFQTESEIWDYINKDRMEQTGDQLMQTN